MPTYTKLSKAINDESFVSENVDKGQVEPLADIVIVGIVSWRDLDGTSTELHVDKCVGDDGQHAASDGMLHVATVQVSVPDTAQARVTRVAKENTSLSQLLAQCTIICCSFFSLKYDMTTCRLPPPIKCDPN